MKYDEALKIIFDYEGGYANDPDDHGGATNFGITQATYSAWLKSQQKDDKSVKLITREEASKIYYQNYWLDGKCNALPFGVGLVHFDMCVNAGIVQAAKLLQRALRVQPDGIIGSITIRAAAESDPIKVITRYTLQRVNFYKGLADDFTQRKFWAGWLTRALDCSEKAYAETWKHLNIR